MTLTIDSFQEFISYKKDLSKTLRTCMKSKYSVIGCIMGGKTRNVIVCGKEHDALLHKLDQLELHKSTLGKGTYEAGTFHPSSGKVMTPELLKELSIDDLTSVYAKKLDKEAKIPGSSHTWAEFERLVQEAERRLPGIKHAKIKKKFEAAINAAKETLAGIEQGVYNDVDTHATALLHWPEMDALYPGLRREVDRWLVIAKKQNPQAHKILESTSRKLENDDMRLELRADELKHALALFKSPENFSKEEDLPGGTNAVTQSLNDSVVTATGLGDLYGNAKKKLLNGMDTALKNPKSLLYDETKEFIKHLPALFKADLKEKLVAVDESADAPVDQRKKVIEKALLATRQYISGLKEILNLDKVKVGGGNSAMLFSATLHHIHDELLSLHSAATPPSKK